MKYELAFLGAGNMAEAIARGLVKSKLFSANRLVAFDPTEARRGIFSGLNIAIADANKSAAADAATILLCVKPQKMNDVLAEIAGAVSADQLVISIAAGISTGFIESRLGEGVRVIRAMPNTPLLVGAGATAVCRGRNANTADLATARLLFESGGIVVDVDEPYMDAVTAVSGSGPAYFFYLVEHMIAAATSLGLSESHAVALVKQTAIGAAKLLETSAELPGDLRRKVTSPGGTTAAAIDHLESQSVGEAIEGAIAAARERGRELGR